MLVPAFLYRSDNLVCDGKLKSQSGSKDFIVERQFQGNNDNNNKCIIDE